MSTTPATPATSSTPVTVVPVAPAAPATATRAPASRKVVASKPAVKPVGPVSSSVSAKSAPKGPAKADRPASKPAAKPLAKAFAQSDKPAKVEKAPMVAGPAKAGAKPAKPEKPAKVKKTKLVRERFTATEDDVAVLRALKQRAGKLATPVKKGTVLRAGIRALTGLSDTALVAFLKQTAPIK